MSADPRRPERRLAYRAAVDRPRLVLPGEKRVVVWPVVNVEHWLIDNPMPRQVLVAPTAAALLPDLPNWAWHEYGMRVGFWRFLDAFARRGIRPTLSINGSVCEAYPRVAAASRDAGWEFMGHGFHQVPTQRVEDEPAMIARTVEAIARFAGGPPLGWLGPGLTETLDTPDHLAAAGIRYVGDWPMDDRPCRLRTRHGPLVTLPYSVELNDIPVLAIQHHGAEEFLARALAQVERLAAEAASAGPLGGAKVMGFAIHPYITGVPHRIAVVERLLDALAARSDVLFWQGRDILDWYLGTGDDA
ncbi:polysaccharide deacetylase [Methylobacterium sp. 4-46]|uniref:polysaccharide deacetylase family protein n=1 Tax=unclassified Methylobacterium TaxID=2615210 RepID=UPI000152C906|nr:MULTISPECIES: polysaccharide deacetylase family protein [Methylobacterium]ACA14968.1 polysaccharide deacetylase [Methylobacterium sp. 4-46]WFT80706.1 polysaccharide deacetylase family protein [Methylobacterium nodulans]